MIPARQPLWSPSPTESRLHVIESLPPPSRVTPHVPRRLTIPGSRLFLYIVGQGRSRASQVRIAMVRIAYRHRPNQPACIFVDPGIFPDVDLTDAKRLPDAFDAFPDCVLRRFEAPPRIDWSKERPAPKLPYAAEKWWDTFSSMPFAAEGKSFVCIVAPDTARFLLEILQPGDTDWRKNEPRYLCPRQELTFQWVDVEEEQLVATCLPKK